ncbi:MAG: hypothetical protein K2O78_01910 [Muribaculaceae bacterium]|nr:hypothetical protein [Muribaculaceae bacterium]MDE7080399.1 hypothetical protein [Muribaculaceae bacterium]
MSDQTTTHEGADEGRAMELYEYIVNHVDECRGKLDNLIIELRRADASGQFLASSARFLAAVDREGFADYLPVLIEGAIAKDRERRYIGQLLEAIWGKDYTERVDELVASDDVFRRLYKRVYPAGTFD